MPVDYKKYNELPWWGYTKIADNFPTFGISAASRNDLINGDVDESTKKRIASFIIAASIILALVLLLILPAAVAGPGLFAAGGIAAIAPMITGGVGLLGAAAYFGIKSYQNAKFLKRNLDLAEKRDKIIAANQKYSNIDKNKQIKNDPFKNKYITKEGLSQILYQAKNKFPNDSKLAKIYAGAELLTCCKTKGQDNKISDDDIDVNEKFNEIFGLSSSKSNHSTSEKNDALLAYLGAIGNHDVEQLKENFYDIGVPDNVVNIALNNAVGSYYQEIDKKNFTRKFYDKKQSDKFGFRENAKGDFQESKEADLFDKEIGIQKANPWGETLGSLIATLPIMTAFYNVGKSSSVIDEMKKIKDSNNEIDGIVKSYENGKKIDSDVFRLDSSGDGRVTIDECKAYASSKGIAEQDVYDWMKSYGITPPTSTSSTTVESIVMNKSLGAGFTKYINDHYSSDKSTIDPKVFDTYNSSRTTYDETTKKLTISFGSPAETITLDEKEMKRFAAATGISFTAGDKDAFSKAVLAKYKVFATEIKSASIYKDLSGKNNKNPDGWNNYLNGLKKQNGFAADSTKGASETPTTINIPAEMSKAEWTAYEEFFYNNIPTLCQKLKSNGYLDPQDVKDLVDSLFDSPQIAPWLDKEISNGMTLGDFKTYLLGAGPGAIDYLENFSKYMYYSVQPNGAKDAAKCLTNMNALLDKMCSEEPGKSYTEQFWREKFNVSVGDGSATREVEKFKKNLSSWIKVPGNTAKVANNFGHLFSGEESKKIKAASTTKTITVNWSTSKSLNMLGGNNVAPSDDKVGLQKHLQKQSTSVVISDDMKNAAIVGVLGGLGAGLVGGVAAYDERKDNKKNNQYFDVVEEAKRKRTSSKDDDFDALFDSYYSKTEQKGIQRHKKISNKVTTAKNGAAPSSLKVANQADMRAKQPVDFKNKNQNQNQQYTGSIYKMTKISDPSSRKGSHVSKPKNRSISDQSNLTKG